MEYWNNGGVLERWGVKAFPVLIHPLQDSNTSRPETPNKRVAARTPMSKNSQATAPAPERTQQRILDLFANKPRMRLTPVEIQKRGGFAPNELQSIVDALRNYS